MNIDSVELDRRLATLQGEDLRYKQVFELMDEFRWSSRNEPNWTQNLLLVGESGVGKTHLVRNYKQRVTGYWGDAAIKESCSVLYVTIPFAFSMQSLYSHLLTTLGAPATNIRSIDGRRHETHRLMKSHSVKMVVIDEADLLLLARPSVRVEAMEAIMEMNRATNASTVLVGTQKAVSLIY